MSQPAPADYLYQTSTNHLCGYHHVQVVYCISVLYRPNKPLARGEGRGDRLYPRGIARYLQGGLSSVIASPYRRRDRWETRYCGICEHEEATIFLFLDLREGSPRKLPTVLIPTNTAASRKLPASMHPKANGSSRITRPVYSKDGVYPPGCAVGGV